MDKTLAERLRDCAQGVSLGADGMGWSPDPALLEEAADATRWRSIEDEQPRNGQEVLATIYPYRNKINRQMIVHAVYVDAVWLDPADREPLHEPTHWMPAPALPDGA